MVRTLSLSSLNSTWVREGKSNQMRKWTLLDLATTTTPTQWTLTKNPKVWHSMDLSMSGYISIYARATLPKLYSRLPIMSRSSSALRTIRVIALSDKSRLRYLWDKPQVSHIEMPNRNRRFLRRYRSARCQSWWSTRVEISRANLKHKHRGSAT